MQTLDERKQKILEAIIYDYLETAEPVGSRRISRKYNLNISPATIRNEMTDLEEAGYIKQPHTSAGRIPSDKGYRFYVDRLMKQKELTQKEHSFIKKEYKKIGRDIEGLLHETLRIMTILSHYVTVLTAPDIHHKTSEPNKVYASGISNILNLPEFKDLAHLKHILKIIEHEEILSHLMNDYAELDTTVIKIGRENKIKEIKDCSIVVTTYHFSRNSLGTLGIIGPTRMSYEKITSLINSVAHELNTRLTGDAYD